MNIDPEKRIPHMKKQKYLVEVKLPATLGETKKVRVDALSPADALVQAALALDQQGITHWDLVKSAPVLN